MDKPVTGLIDEENLGPFLSILCHLAGCELDSTLVESVRSKLPGTWAERGDWLDYTFEGSERCDLRIGYDEPGTGVIMVEVSASPENLPKVEMARHIMWEYGLKDI